MRALRNMSSPVPRTEPVAGTSIDIRFRVYMSFLFPGYFRKDVAHARADIAQVRAARGRWYTSTFRWLSIYAAIFSLSILLLGGIIAWRSVGVINHDSDALLTWQILYFNAYSDHDLPIVVYQRVERERLHADFYGLFDKTGHRICGDIDRLPAGLRSGLIGETLKKGQLNLRNGESSPVVRAMAISRLNGDTFVIAKDMANVDHLRSMSINVLTLGGVLCLIVGVTVGLALSRRQLARVSAIRQLTTQIAQGNIHQRLPIESRDEIGLLSHIVNHMLDEVERLMKEVKSACDGIAHDLRTPLIRVRSLLSHIATSSAEGDSDINVLAHVDLARAETEALLSRFSALLRISEIATMQRHDGFAAVNLTEIVIQLHELYQPVAESQEIEWQVSTEPTREVFCDRELLFEAFSNIIDNALKFTPAGGTVSLRIGNLPAGVQITISDTGPGIPADEFDAILHPFYRSEHTRHIPGSGLGLSIVSSIFRMHDFAMSISNANPGTRVTVDCRA